MDGISDENEYRARDSIWPECGIIDQERGNGEFDD